FGKAAHVVMALDRPRGAVAALDDVGIDGPLRQVADVPQLPRFFLEDPAELLADALPLYFRIRDAFQPLQKPRPGVHVDAPLPKAPPERLDHLLRLAQAEKSVVDADGRQLVAHAPVD